MPEAVGRSFGSYLAKRGVTKESDVDTYLKLVKEARYGPTPTNSSTIPQRGL